MTVADVPRLSVVVLVTAGEREALAACLASVARHPVVGGQEVIVVDNASGDGSVAMVEQGFPDARIVRNARNLGVAVGRNQGIAHARGRYVAMLDSDVVVHEGALARLCRLLDERPDAGLVGPRLEFPDGRLQRSARRIPSPAALVANRATRLPGMASLPARRRHLMMDEPHDRTMEVEYLLGAAMVFPRALAAEVGGFDGDVTLRGYGFDDADWALRVRAAGRRVIYHPAARVTHTYRRRLSGQGMSVGNVAMVLSYLRLRVKHAPRRGRLRRPADRLARRAGVPVARIAMALARLSGRRAGVALVYHRFAPRSGDPARELVPAHSAQLVEAQLRHVAATYRVVGADDLLPAVRRRRRGERFPVAITFDDDLLSHATFALPLLRDHGLSATFFLCGASLGGPHSFWWERLQAAADDRRADALAGIGVEVVPDGDGIHRIAARIESQPPESRAAAARALADLIPAPVGAGLRAVDVAALAAEGMRIGFHTRDHDALPTLDDDRLRDALVTGRAELESASGHPLRAIAYPHGKAGPREAEAAASAGFASGFTTAPGAVTPESDPLLLGRVEPSFVSAGHLALRVAATVLRPRATATG